jgi:hypothetical protein
MVALAKGALRVLWGKETARSYEDGIRKDEAPKLAGV